jgi:magnesium chelatase family protein
MYGKVLSSCVHGIEGQIIEVEVDINPGLPCIQIVGLPDSAVRESIERVRSALKNCDFQFPTQRVTVNLAPADLRKEGSVYDLPIAAGILKASGQLAWENSKAYMFIGELSLDGTVRPVPGVLSMVHEAKKQGIHKVMLPLENSSEAQLIEAIDILPLRHLNELRHFIQSNAGENQTIDDMNLINDINNECHEVKIQDTKPSTHAEEDYADVKGHHHAKRALMIAAAGLHNLLFIGPPGSGKTMLMKRLPSILPPLTNDELIEVMKIYSVANQSKHRAHSVQRRPYRSPHHTISAAGLVGGGGIPKPGEVSLAHLGVLFLDELPEFTRAVLEVMRQPLEDHQVTISRARAVYTYPSQFMLTASMNPCPCGFSGYESNRHACSCSPLKIQHYRSRISGPLLDRIDLQVEVPRVEVDILQTNEASLSSEEMKKKVYQVHSIQQDRFHNLPFSFNSELRGKWLKHFCRLDPQAVDLMKHSFVSLGYSMRAHDRILKIARTIADLSACETITIEHLAEAIQYRCLDRAPSPMKSS